MRTTCHDVRVAFRNQRLTYADLGADAEAVSVRLRDLNDREKALDVAWKSSPVSSVPTWKSPVLFIHGDDDRNVRFSQTVDLVQRIAAKGVEYEELVIVDDTHHFMRHANQLRVNAAIAAYLEKKLKLPKM